MNHDKNDIEGGGGYFIDDYHSSLKLMLFWIKSYYNIKSTRYNITNSGNKLSGRSLLIKIADT